MGENTLGGAGGRSTMARDGVDREVACCSDIVGTTGEDATTVVTLITSGNEKKDTV